MINRRRRGLIAALAALALAACNGGAGTGSVASLSGGIGGSGITGVSYGPITAFGSVFVNGVEFDISKALANNQVYADGMPVSAQTDLGLGMVVAVTGTFNSDHKTGIASKVEYYDDLLGPVQSVVPASGTLKILNLPVVADVQTLFTGNAAFTVDPTANLTVLDNLMKQQGTVYVEVSGLWDPAGTLHATRIAVKTNFSGEAELRGSIDQLDVSGSGFFLLHGIPVNYQGASLQVSLKNALSVEVYGHMDATSGTFVASRVVPDDAALAGKVGTLNGQVMDLQGLVNNLDTSAKTFSINGVPINYASAKIESETGNTFTLQNGVRVEVKGTVQNGVLVLRRMEGEDMDSSKLTAAGVLVNISTTPVQSTDPATHTIVLDLNPSDPSAALTVKVTPTTVFEDKRNLGLSLNYNSAFGNTAVALQQGSRVEVDGYRDTTSGVITAIRVEVKS